MNTYVLEITYPKNKRNQEDPFTKLAIQQADDPVAAIEQAWLGLRYVGSSVTVRVFPVADEPIHAEYVRLKATEVAVGGSGPIVTIEEPMAALTEISGD